MQDVQRKPASFTVTGVTQRRREHARGLALRSDQATRPGFGGHPASQVSLGLASAPLRVRWGCGGEGGLEKVTLPEELVDDIVERGGADVVDPVGSAHARLADLDEAAEVDWRAHENQVTGNGGDGGFEVGQLLRPSSPPPAARS